MDFFTPLLLGERTLMSFIKITKIAAIEAQEGEAQDAEVNPLKAKYSSKTSLKKLHDFFFIKRIKENFDGGNLTWNTRIISHNKLAKIE